MEYIFVSMPHARFDSPWFANVPNINLGMLQGFLSKMGKTVRTFHFHMEYLSHVKSFGPGIEQRFVKLSREFGVEYLSLDYVFASLLFPDVYEKSQDRFRARLDPIGLTLNDFEMFRDVAKSFVNASFARMTPWLKGAELVGFSCSHYQLSGSLLMASKIKQAFPDIRIIVGGKDCAGPFARELISNVEFLDFVAFGEAEVTVVSLLEHLADDKQELFNVWYKNGKGEVELSDAKENFSLDSLPFPEYDFEALPLPLGEIILPLEFGRGCPWGKCTFCPDRAYQIKCQSKTAERIKAEVDHYGKTSPELVNFFILDSDALKEPETVVMLSDHFKKMGLRFHFAEFRAERMNRPVIQALLDFGQWASPFQVGIETFSDRVLCLMQKGVSVLKNVEVLKMAAELNVPLQFNLFTCYPNMTTDDLRENLRVMELITHILAVENIQFFPGEFYLPADCPIFVNIDGYKVRKNTQSLFADMFEDFSMPSYSNYPYAYAFDNDEEQYHIAVAIRKKAEEIKGKNPANNYMRFREDLDGLFINVCRDGQKTAYTLRGVEKELYRFAVGKACGVVMVSDELGVSPNTVRMVLNDLEQKGLILYASDRDAYLSLATRCKEPV
jgi:hypothetical protein